MRAVRAADGIDLVERKARLQVPPWVLQCRRPDPNRPKNIYLREDRILLHLTALAILCAARETPDRARKASVTAPARVADLIDQLRVTGTVLTYDPDARTIRAGDDTAVAIAVTAGRHS